MITISHGFPALSDRPGVAAHSAAALHSCHHILPRCCSVAMCQRIADRLPELPLAGNGYHRKDEPVPLVRCGRTHRGAPAYSARSNLLVEKLMSAVSHRAFEQTRSGVSRSHLPVHLLCDQDRALSSQRCCELLPQAQASSSDFGSRLTDMQSLSSGPHQPMIHRSPSRRTQSPSAL